MALCKTCKHSYSNLNVHVLSTSHKQKLKEQLNTGNSGDSGVTLLVRRIRSFRVQLPSLSLLS